MISPPKTGTTRPLAVLLGVVMTLAVLSHTRMFFHYWDTDPNHLESTTPFLFFTWFISHYFTPVVYFITGVTICLLGQTRTRPRLSRYLLLRGAGFLLLELTLDNFSWTFDPRYRITGLFIFGGTGLCMILLAVLIYLPRKWLLILGIVIAGAHNMLDPIRMEGTQPASILWYILHQQTFIPAGDRVFVINHTLLPWSGIMIAGYALGPVYAKKYSSAARKRGFLRLGAGAIALFFILRAINIYGDPSPWTTQKDPVYTLIDFFRLTRYPGSLDLLLITLGPAWLFLSALEGTKNNRLISFFTVFSAVPVFCYLFSTYLIHFAAAFVLWARGKNWKDMILTPGSYGSGSPLAGYGYNPGTVYLIWIVIITVLYFACKYYLKLLKARNFPGR